MQENYPTSAAQLLTLNVSCNKCRVVLSFNPCLVFAWTLALFLQEPLPCFRMNPLALLLHKPPCLVFRWFCMFTGSLLCLKQYFGNLYYWFHDLFKHEMVSFATAIKLFSMISSLTYPDEGQSAELLITNKKKCQSHSHCFTIVLIY